MSDFKKIPLFFNASTGEQIDENGFVIRENAILRLFVDESVVLCCTFLRPQTVSGITLFKPIELSDQMSYSAIADTEQLPGDGLLWASEDTSLKKCVNVEKDWLNGQTANLKSGQLSFRISTNTVRFAQITQNAGKTNCKLCILGIPFGQTEKTVLALCRFRAENRPCNTPLSPPENLAEYYNIQQINSLLRSGMELEFSADNVIWENEQNSTHEFLHFRNRSLGGAWSEPIRLTPGPPGIQGAPGVPGEKGEKGDQGDPGEAVGVKYQYSIDKVNWVDRYTPSAGNIVSYRYRRDSLDQGVTWGVPYLFCLPDKTFAKYNQQAPSIINFSSDLYSYNLIITNDNINGGANVTNIIFSATSLAENIIGNYTFELFLHIKTDLPNINFPAAIQWLTLPPVFEINHTYCFTLRYHCINMGSSTPIWRWIANFVYQTEYVQS